MQLSFDRGTLVIDALPAGTDAADLPGLAWDPRVDAFRAAAYRYADIAATLARRGVPYSDAVRSDNDPLGHFSGIALRDYQGEAIEAWSTAGCRGVIVLPTGAGKTHVALAAMARARSSVLCLVPTRALMAQWRQVLARTYDTTIGCLGDERHELAPITVATFESAYRWMARIGNRFEMLVIDEAHHFGVGLRDEALEMSAATKRLGLTATPPTSPAAAACLGRLVGPIVFERSIGDLTGSYLAPFEQVTCILTLTPAEHRRYVEWATPFEKLYAAFRLSTPGGTWQELIGVAVRTTEGRVALAGWHAAHRLLALTDAKRARVRKLLDQHAGSRVLVFTADNASAYRIARDELVTPITCHIVRTERDTALARFRSGELNTLVSSRVLNEGIDVPDADVAILVGGALGRREQVQRIGRVLRPAPGKRALVYELITTGTFEMAQARRRRPTHVARKVARA